MAAGAQGVREAIGRVVSVQDVRDTVHKGRTMYGRSALARRASGDAPAPRRSRILAYHSVGTRRWGLNDVTPRTFEQHLQAAVDDGRTFATPAQVLADPDR